MKRFLSVICVFALLLTIITPREVSAVDLIMTDKEVYVEGEDIMVTADGYGNDWVGIYLDTDIIPDNPSIYWYYVDTDGNASGKAKNIFDAEYTNNRTELESLPAGFYTIYLFADNGYQIISEVSITIITKEEATATKNPTSSDSTQTQAPTRTLSAPKNVTYIRDKKIFTGLANGTLKITAGDGTLPYYYQAYWGNSSGPLQGYTAFAPIECIDEITEYKIVENTLIPREADRIYVYATIGSRVSDATVVMLPEGCNDYDFGEPLYEMQVLSDIHINVSQTHVHNRNFALALNDIKTLSPNSIGIFINGDMADHGLEDEYKSMKQLIEEAGSDIPDIFCSVGNHDLSYGGDYQHQVQLFYQYTEPAVDRVYFDKWINGAHFIFLGSEAPGLNAQLSDTQLQWFRDTLAENRDPDRPIYVFLHQGLIDTVAGTFGYQGWHGINQAAEFADIIKDYKEIVLFSGHSHWEMDSLNNMKAKDKKLPTIFNTASVAYLWNDYSMSSNIEVPGSQGYYVKAYQDKILVLGRDFVNGQWIASAQFVVMLEDDSPADDGLDIAAIVVIIVVAVIIAVTGAILALLLSKKRKIYKVSS